MLVWFQQPATSTSLQRRMLTLTTKAIKLDGDTDGDFKSGDVGLVSTASNVNVTAAKDVDLNATKVIKLDGDTDDGDFQVR